MPKRLVDGEGIWRSQKLRQVELKYRGEYANLIPLAEDRGSFECDPRLIWAAVYVCNRPDVTLEDVEKILAEFERVGLLIRWTLDSKVYGYWVGIDKPGLLPKPSERHSTLPTPSGGGKGAAEARQGGADSAGLPRTGFGLGSGFGSGFGSGEENNSCAVVASSTDDNQKQDQKQKQNQPQHQRPNPSGIDSPAKTALAIVKHLTICGHMPMETFKPDDPTLPLLVSLTEEALAVRLTEPAEIFRDPKNWDKEELTDSDYDYITVNPGDPRYPGPDESMVKKSLTIRDCVASQVCTQLLYAYKWLDFLSQYLKDFVEPCPEEGTIAFSEQAIRDVVKAMGRLFEETPWNASPAEYAAILHWAFKVSGHWPAELKCLKNVIHNYKEMAKQYKLYYRHCAKGKMPHDLGVGWPETRATVAAVLEDVNDL